MINFHFRSRAPPTGNLLPSRKDFCGLRGGTARQGIEWKYDRHIDGSGGKPNEMSDTIDGWYFDFWRNWFNRFVGSGS